MAVLRNNKISKAHGQTYTTSAQQHSSTKFSKKAITINSSTKNADAQRKDAPLTASAAMA